MNSASQSSANGHHVRWSPEVPETLHGGGRFVRSRQQFIPAYRRLHEAGQLRPRAEAALEALRECRLCPRRCGANRWADGVGYCRAGRRARVSSAFPHLGEEDCLSGRHGSGTIFFSSCNLRCVFCQNAEISHLGEGRELEPSELAECMRQLQAEGCHNINLVTPGHVVPQVLEALVLAVEEGLHLPLVYNTSAYDNLETIRWLDGIVDIYMPDFKLWHPTTCRRLLHAEDYPETARAALRAMHRQVGDLVVDQNGLALRGLLVRHLVMPGLVEDTRAILRFLAEEISRDTYVNLMDQYHPAWKARQEPRFRDIARPLYQKEFDQALAIAHEIGLWRLDKRWITRSMLLRGW